MHGGVSRNDAILDSAKQLFTKKGYDATSMNLIANKVGITKAALYYYFDSKESILVELMDRALKKSAYLIDKKEKSEEDYCNYNIIENRVTKLLDFFIQEKDVFRIMLVEYLKDNKKDKGFFFKIPSELFTFSEGSLSDDVKIQILLHIFSFITFQTLNEKLSIELNIDKKILEKLVKNDTVDLVSSCLLKNYKKNNT